ncbi:putative C6 transcription factor [Aspergillus clavatus NRRL 1]|uniref:C6 transcription factor, putative n=1 Tax=Aspergillus clavatus (strain ATCC 1007 / CBS 513.65 / DSM 816 / NCTC 3887 / NRRL 1 / QM 1276 / 107) TaxID=344612 RepID=A1CUN4_ASPCL|nr:C6 transcription factor, putative [Aspergillus clavatus NRRL 1]EAW07021.1 C6 transcription factor, putative [Aspergillus clavatus NRRL 1]
MIFSVKSTPSSISHVPQPSSSLEVSTAVNPPGNVGSWNTALIGDAAPSNAHKIPDGMRPVQEEKSQGETSAGPSPSPIAISNGERLPETVSRPSTDLVIPTQTKCSSLRELELMHKYSTETYSSLSNNPLDYHVWQMAIPRKALDHDFLLSGILAVASLHIASTLEPPDALSYIDTAMEYHNQAFAPYRRAIDNLTPLNCDAVFAHSVLTTVIGIALPRLTAERDESPSITENVIVVFELLQGVSKIFRISRQWLKMKLFTSQDEVDNGPAVKLDSETDHALRRLAALNDDIVAAVDPEQYRIVKEAISLLHGCFTRYATCKDAASVLRWLATASNEFAHALRCRKPFPLMVLMYWGVLLGELDGTMWWARNSGPALVSELLAVLQPGDIRWEEARLWPKHKMGL